MLKNASIELQEEAALHSEQNSSNHIRNDVVSVVQLRMSMCTEQICKDERYQPRRKAPPASWTDPTKGGGGRGQKSEYLEEVQISGRVA